MHRLLRSVWDEPAPGDPPGRSWRDWALLGLVVPVAILEGVLRPDIPARVVTVVVMVALAPTLLWRRTRPLLMLAIALGAGTIESLAIGADPDLNTMVVLLLLPYALFRWGSGRAMLGGVALIIGKSMTSVAAGHLGLGDAVGTVVVLGSAFALAMALRYRTALVDVNWTRCGCWNASGWPGTCTTPSRTTCPPWRSARRPGLARPRRSPTAATDALRVIEAEASRALAEMRTMVRILRDDQPAALTPSPRIADLLQLRRAPAHGPRVEVEIVGDVDASRRRSGRRVYRLAQESVTNARRHARHATRIEVRVAADDGRYGCGSATTGNRSDAARPHGVRAGRHGRARRACSAAPARPGPSPDRGWTVAAVLPRAGSGA